MNEPDNDTLADLRLTLEIGLENLETALYHLGDLHTRAALVAWEQLLRNRLGPNVSWGSLNEEGFKKVAKLAWTAGGIFAEESQYHVDPPVRLEDDDDEGVDLSIMPQVSPEDKGGA